MMISSIKDKVFPNEFLNIIVSTVDKMKKIDINIKIVVVFLF